MRSDASAYDLIAPPTLDGVLATMHKEERTPIAGGTELMVALCAGRLQAKRFVSLQQLSELRFIDSLDPTTLRLGANTTFTDLRRSEIIAREFPLLAQTASWTGSIANQNRGTLGGNIANASPAADNPPVLLAYDAELELLSSGGVRRLPYCEFHHSYKQTELRKGELIQAIRLPRRFAGHVLYVRKVGTRNAQAISKIALAGTACMAGDSIAEIALGAASLLDRPARLPLTEAVLTNSSVRDGATMKRAATVLREEISPIDDVRSTRRYREMVAVNLLQEFLQNCTDYRQRSCLLL